MGAGNCGTPEPLAQNCGVPPNPRPPGATRKPARFSGPGARVVVVG
ncbi:hypothetical protein MWH26_09840 [Hymenobacter sublimis]|uniref:Uncharacterized protein n=1 Tax=Hymenobacter sublimis TaxID=2933777 RepID=A0ABY4JIS0_9BACT|nr:hypothetical protein MWH26_09840 [Hymenobacter sublimis]